MTLTVTTEDNIKTVATVDETFEALDAIADNWLFQRYANRALRFAESYTGDDLGAKINTAIADLPSSGGTVMMPAGTHDFSTMIDFGHKDNVRLQGQGWGSNPYGAGTDVTVLNYTGTGTAIWIGSESAVAWCNSPALAGFTLQYPAVSEPAIFIDERAYHGFIDGVRLEGTSKTGTGIGFFGRGNNIWSISNLFIRDFDVGLDVEHNNQSTYRTCHFYACRVNVRMGFTAAKDTPIGIVFLGGSNCVPDEDAFQIRRAHAITIVGMHMELGAGAGRRVIRCGTADANDMATAVSAIGCYMTGGTTDYAVTLERVRGFQLLGGRQHGFDTALVENLATSVAGCIIKPGYSPGLDRYDDATGIVEATDKDDNIIYPNLPASDPSVVGALWNDSGDVKVST